MSKIAYEHMMSLVEPCIYMEMRGMKIDVELRTKKSHEFQSKLDRLETRLSFNPHSPKQVADHLYGELKIPKQYHRKTKKLTTNDEALEKIYASNPIPAIKAIIACRHMKKMKSTYFEIPLHKGRMLPSLNITGTETGRLASDLHSFPKAYADIVIADDGYVLVEPDLSQAEARVVAWLTGEEAIKSFFQKPGADVHTEVAITIGSVRDIGKRLVHAGNYLIGSTGFAAVAKCPVYEARRHLSAYYHKFPSIPRWHEKVIKQIKSTRTMTTALGRKRVFYGRFGNDLWREAIAYEPQSIVGDTLNKGLRRLYDLGFDILFQKHDAVLLQVKEPLTQLLVDIIKGALSIKIIINGQELIIPVEIASGKNWKKSELGGGMQKWKEVT